MPNSIFDSPAHRQAEFDEVLKPEDPSLTFRSFCWVASCLHPNDWAALQDHLKSQSDKEAFDAALDARRAARDAKRKAAHDVESAEAAAESFNNLMPNAAEPATRAKAMDATRSAARPVTRPGKITSMEATRRFREMFPDASPIIHPAGTTPKVL